MLLLSSPGVDRDPVIESLTELTEEYSNLKFNTEFSNAQSGKTQDEIYQDHFNISDEDVDELTKYLEDRVVKGAQQSDSKDAALAKLEQELIDRHSKR